MSVHTDLLRRRNLGRPRAVSCRLVRGADTGVMIFGPVEAADFFGFRPVGGEHLS